MVNKYRLSLEAVRLHSNDFPYWQHRKSTGRRPVHERDLLIAFLVRQLFDATFRETEGLLVMLAGYFDLEYVPDHSVLCKKNASRRWLALWKRFFSYVLERLPGRTVVVATYASGFSGRKQSWRETDYAVKANQDWVKIHAAIEVDEFFVLNYCLTKSNVHDSKMFAKVWEELPSEVRIKRSPPTRPTTAKRAWQRPGSMGQHLCTGSRRTPGTSLTQRHFTKRWSRLAALAEQGRSPVRQAQPC